MLLMFLAVAVRLLGQQSESGLKQLADTKPKAEKSDTSGAGQRVKVVDDSVRTNFLAPSSADLKMHSDLKTIKRPLTTEELNTLESMGYDTSSYDGRAVDFPADLKKAPTNRRPLTAEELKTLESMGYNTSSYDGRAIEMPVTQPLLSKQKTPKELAGATIFVKEFLGNTNRVILADVISMKAGSLKFSSNGKEFEHSGRYTVILQSPRTRTQPALGLGSFETAKLVILNDVQGKPCPLQDPTIIEKSVDFVVVISGKGEWIHSGSYSIQK